MERTKNENEDLTFNKESLFLKVIAQAYKLYNDPIVRNTNVHGGFYLGKKILTDREMELISTDEGVNLSVKIDKGDKREVFLTKDYMKNRLSNNGILLALNHYIKPNDSNLLVSMIKPEFKENAGNIILPNTSKDSDNNEILMQKLKEDPSRAYVEKVGPHLLNSNFDVYPGDIVSIHPNINPVPIIIDNRKYLLIDYTKHVLYKDERYRKLIYGFINGVDKDSFYSLDIPERVSIDEYKNLVSGNSNSEKLDN